MEYAGKWRIGVHYVQQINHSDRQTESVCVYVCTHMYTHLCACTCVYMCLEHERITKRKRPEDVGK